MGAFFTLSPLAAFAVACLVAWLIKGEWPDLRLLGQANYLPYLGIGVLFLWIYNSTGGNILMVAIWYAIYPERLLRGISSVWKEVNLI